MDVRWVFRGLPRLWFSVKNKVYILKIAASVSCLKLRVILTLWKHFEKVMSSWKSSTTHCMAPLTLYCRKVLSCCGSPRNGPSRFGLYWECKLLSIPLISGQPLLMLAKECEVKCRTFFGPDPPPTFTWGFKIIFFPFLRFPKTYTFLTENTVL